MQQQLDSSQSEARSQLIDLLKGGNAHVSLQVAVRDLKPENRTLRPYDLPYSIWALVSHIRITQWDNLEFSRDSTHISPKWPQGYWPQQQETVTDTEWYDGLKSLFADRREFLGMIENEENDLFKPFPHGEGQNLFHEAFLIADHTAYHTGEIVLLRRLLNDWNP